MKAALDSADSDFLSLLRRLGPKTVQELGEAMEVTATAVRQRLARLQAQGFVDRNIVREGRGRPYHRYEVTEKGLRELGDNYGDLAMILWRELQRIGDPVVRDLVLERIRESLIARIGRLDGETVVDRLEQLRSSLQSRGYDVEVGQSSGLPVLRENICPYHELADQDRAICELEREVYRNVLKADISLARCCLDGHRCCEFTVAETPTVVAVDVVLTVDPARAPQTAAG